MESYPRQCRYNNQTFVEDIGNELEKSDLIRIDFPRPNEIISSPLIIKGEARGAWFFEASFPIFLTDWDGKIIAQGIATTKSNWMTEDFVPFEATLDFSVDKNAYSNKGSLILKKDNPSGLPENDDALEIPVVLFGDIIACTQEAKLCPDGSAVGRIEPDCEFAQCPTINPLPVTECKKDSDCLSSNYVCQETQGTGTACPSIDPSCTLTYTIIRGECKLKEGNRCSADLDCAAGNLCHKNICTSPIGRQCSGPSDTSCPTDFECVQGCGSPVGYPDEPPPPYFCQLKGYIRRCPICLASNTSISTPSGDINVKNIKVGMHVWSLNKKGEKVVSTITKISSTNVIKTHKVVHLVLFDKREVWVSLNHPTINVLSVGELKVGDLYDGSKVWTSEFINYWDNKTYDILPDSETGYYWASGILLGSTLAQ